MSMSVMILRSGRLVDPFALRPEDVDPRDIAYHTAGIFRYCGATRLTVAEHMVRGSEWLEKTLPVSSGPCYDWHAVKQAADSRKNIIKWFLLHDATEAYLGDIHRSIKTRPEMLWYREAEDRMQREVIAPRFDLSPTMPPEVGELDRAMCGQEMALLCHGNPQDHDGTPRLAIPGMLVGTWTPAEAEVCWLNRLIELWGRMP